ncbi:sigma-70 family RNA polymerase sigma factor [Oligoflexus tunisiensis]|uniref:sigma-70 family RNA polymerase sigma factor n=1 Tax=Oligoflexus tunisiensis TaxID=708132 RepID=UPI00114C9FB0|nr:sigma-70 family RNA polymerase sigma factor [Oligoflexus tunisiensis]
MDDNSLIQVQFMDLWTSCQSLLETLSLVDVQQFLTRVAAQAASWNLDADKASCEADRLRLLLLVARELHPLPARLDRQLAALPGSNELARALHEAAQIMPHKLVETHWELVRKAAARYHIPSKVENEAEFQELQSVGREALFRAAQKYYKKPRGSFKGFAWPLIRESMREEQARRHPVPFKIRKKLAALGALREEAHLRELTFSKEEIRTRLKLSPEEFHELLQIEAVWGNGLEFETDVELEDIEAPDQRLDQLSMLLEIEDQRRLDHAMDRMIDPEKTLIARLYFEEKTLREVAEEMQLSLPSFKKLHKKALGEMKRLLNRG